MSNDRAPESGEHEKSGANEGILGIDLGTTNSLVAVFDAHKTKTGQELGPRVLADATGETIMPSVVRFEQQADGSSAVVVGREAQAKAVEFPQLTISSVKRLMGRSLADAQEDLPYLSYQVVEGAHNTARIALPAGEGAQKDAKVRVISPQEVSAILLGELARRARAALGQTGADVRKAVVTVPAYFDDAQRQATRDAGRLAGLEVVRIVNEPTAAALAYGLGVGRESHPRTVAVFDLGGGTFDISILRIVPAKAEDLQKAGKTQETQNAQPAFFQVLSTAGDTHLGGDDVDHAIMRQLGQQMATQFGIKNKDGAQIDSLLEGFDASTRKALVGFARAIKHRLSEQQKASVEIEVQGQGVLHATITRAEVQTLMAGWMDRAIACCKEALAQAGIDKKEIDAVLMVGGATRMPMVRARVGAFFEREPSTALNPDTVVALGAAVQAGILSGAATGALLLDVIPLSLGIETAGGAVAKLITANSTVPARATEMFTTSVDGQVSIKIHVVQGEREMVDDCRSLGVFELGSLPPMPAGVPQLEVVFLVDAGGVLHVSATERRSGRRAQMQVVPNHGLTRQEVERIEQESVAHAREDMTRHRVVDLIVNARLDLKWIKTQLDKHGPALEPGYRAEIEKLVGQLEEIVKRAETDWQRVDADGFYQAKQALDMASVRLQEVAITASLKDKESLNNQ